ncbi:hypothetical protein PHJA_001112200 [Phtheirospermum japonicum]|uniref:Uncharacterized protein n=1 Tax=Phtheirospermum japonicum TaxID=374723 RepID=A0A830BZV6_9LAMI|nr:hypothetical protein PHJA_001112200 [Phtheirospermum japonicum]
MEREEDQSLIGPSSGPIMSATVGRVMTTLLNAKPKKLQDAVSGLHPPPKIGPLDASLEQSLWFLHKYIGEAADKGEPLDQVLVPILQHSLTFRESKKGNQTLILLNWLFQDELLFQAIVRNMAAIISRRDDRYVALGWCFLGRSLIEHENVANNVSVNAISQKCDIILKTFCACVTHLLSIICHGSNMKEGFELPTRLAVAAADFVLSLTVALTKNDKITKRQKSSSVNVKNLTLNLLPGATNDGDENTLRKTSELSSSLELKLLLLNNLSELITLVEKLTAVRSLLYQFSVKISFCFGYWLIAGRYAWSVWSRKSRSLHAKGLERVSKWLQEIKQLYGSFEDEAELQMLKTGSLLLSSCWKHYGMLMRIEDKFSQQHKELLGQYLSGIQFYADKETEEPNNNSRDSKSETIKFFLNCLLLLLGRLDNQQFGNAIEEFGPQISQVLMSQLRCADEEVIDGTISIFRAVIMRTNHTLSTRSLDDVRQMNALLPMLLSLLDERDAAAKAIVKLLAEYCSICSDNNCLYEVLKRAASENIAQRRNAVDFVADIIRISSGSVNALSQSAWKDIANHLLECLGDEDHIIQNQAGDSIPMIDPTLVLPRLVELSYSTQESLRISADNALISLLVNHKQKPEILCLLLDCLSKLSQNPDSCGPAGRKEGSTLDTDRLLKLLSEWAKHVEDWHVMVGPLIDKMLAEPTNAVIVRFLSHISEYLAEVVDAVFNRLLIIDERFSKGKGLIDTNSEALEREHCLFTRLCPLLLESAASAKDVFKIKVCLFSFCTSLMVRGNDIYRHHPDLFRIKKTIRKVLSWASIDGDESMAIPKDSVLAYVINQLTSDENGIFFESDECDRMGEATNRLSFRLCMANVLISACKKMSDIGKKAFIRKVLPCVIRSVGGMLEPEIRAACVQEKMSGAKLLTCLMASEEDVVESISTGLLQARPLLQDLESTDPSPDVRLMCQQLLLCLTSQ